MLVIDEDTLRIAIRRLDKVIEHLSALDKLYMTPGYKSPALLDASSVRNWLEAEVALGETEPCQS